MRIITDTNILVRFLVKDDVKQFGTVCRLFEACEEIIIPTHVFCELVWVLSRAYKCSLDAVLEIVARLLDSDKTNAHEDAVEAGLRMMRHGGDFADGVNAYTGRQMAAGAAVFMSFDRHAVRLLAQQGVSALVPE